MLSNLRFDYIGYVIEDIANTTFKCELEAHRKDFILSHYSLNEKLDRIDGQVQTCEYRPIFLPQPLSVDCMAFLCYSNLEKGWTELLNKAQ